MKSEKAEKHFGIKRKLMLSFLVILGCAIVVNLVISGIGMLLIRNKSRDLLVDQALSSSTVYVNGQAQVFSNEVETVFTLMNELTDYTEKVYSDRESFVTEHLKLTTEFSPDTSELTMHWLPFEESDLDNPSVLAEADLLSALRPALDSFYQNCPNLISVYIATVTHVNIGYDEDVAMKRDITSYNPESLGAEWYNTVCATKKSFISDAYSDSFGRGLTVTVAVPFFVEGELRGVIGSDINIEGINKSILEISNYEDDYAILFTEDGKPISAQGLTENTGIEQLLGSEAENIVEKIKSTKSGVYQSTINQGTVYVVYDTVSSTGWRLALVLPVDRIVESANESNQYIFFISISSFVFSVIAVLILLIFISKNAAKLSDPITKLTEDAKRIGEGDLNYQSTIETGDEIETLSHSFEKMATSLREYIDNLTTVTAEKERIGTELDIAKNIQASMLPSIFPPFPDRSEFDIYATMDPAKEVGGDFYDFFMVDNRHFAVVMADVSGKGVPAALFMVIGKTLIKDHTNPDRNLGEVFTEVNRMLCESNSEGMFITAFEGILDLVTGEFTFVNAGHEMPFISRGGQKFEPQKIRPGFVLAGMEGVRYRTGSFMLEPGDKLFEYTDGVTEATNENNELYGMERLEKVLESCAELPVTEILPTVKTDIDTFVGKAPQFDDISMLCLEYKKRMDEKDDH